MQRCTLAMPSTVGPFQLSQLPVDGCNSGNFFFSSRKLKHFLLQPQPMLAERVLQSRGFLFCSGEVPLSTLQLSPPVLFCIRRCCAAGPDRSQRAAGFGGARSSVAASHVQVGGGQLCCACSCAVPAAVLCLRLSHALPAAEGRAAVTAVLPVQAMQSTPNYLWSTDDLLGQGATACVYKARSKVRGGEGDGHTATPGQPNPRALLLCQYQSCFGFISVFPSVALWDTS